MKADELVKAMDEALYQVYNKEEEAEELATTGKEVYRGKYDSKDIRNMFIGTLATAKPEKFVDALRDAINKMPDEWVLQFLEVINGDTVEKISESVNEDYELPEEEWYYKHDTDTVYYDITYSIPAVKTIKIDACKGEDGTPEFRFDYPYETDQLPYKVASKLPEVKAYKTEKECIDAALAYFKAIKKNEGIKLNGMKISKPYYEKD